MVNRAQRRKAERQQSSLDRAGMKQAAEQIRRDIDKHGIFDAKAALVNPYYMQQVKARRVAQREQWVQNGITKADVDAAYKEGYAAARSDLVGHYQQFFYAAGLNFCNRNFNIRILLFKSTQQVSQGDK